MNSFNLSSAVAMMGILIVTHGQFFSLLVTLFGPNLGPNYTIFTIQLSRYYICYYVAFTNTKFKNLNFMCISTVCSFPRFTRVISSGLTCEGLIVLVAQVYSGWDNLLWIELLIVCACLLFVSFLHSLEILFFDAPLWQWLDVVLFFVLDNYLFVEDEFK